MDAKCNAGFDVLVPINQMQYKKGITLLSPFLYGFSLTGHSVINVSTKLETIRPWTCTGALGIKPDIADSIDLPA